MNEEYNLGKQVDDLVEYNEDGATNMAHEAMTVIERYVADGTDNDGPLADVTLSDGGLPGIDEDGFPSVRFERNGRVFEIGITAREVIGDE